jgi:hypothetical protein
MRPIRQLQPIFLAALLATGTVSAWAQETVEQQPEEEKARVAEASQTEPATADAEQKETNGNGVDSPKTMSGMSILGNEEAPKSLVIIPWKSSRMGDEISLSDSLDDRAKPVDKDVFLRELRFHEIRSAEQT